LLQIAIGSNNRIAEQLQNFEIDVAIMEWWDPRPGFTATVWHREELQVIVPPDHPWAGRTSIPRNWLCGQALLGGEAGSGTGRLLQSYFGDDARNIGIAMQLGSTEAVKHAVRAGLGISLVMAAAVTDENRDGSLRAIPLEGGALHKDLYVISREDLLPDAPARHFCEFLLQGETAPLAPAP